MATTPSGTDSRSEAVDGAPAPAPQAGRLRQRLASLASRASARDLPHDLAGGVTAGLVSLPISIGFGLFAFRPLGDAYLPHGILAGLYGGVVVSLVVFLLGTPRTLIYAPRSLVTFAVTSIILQLFLTSPEARALTANVPLTLAIVFFVMFLAGMFQFLFGVLRLGELVKYIPYPVIAGFQNAAAVLLLVSQIDILLGLPGPGPVRWSALGATQPLTLLVGASTFAVFWYGRRITRVVPAPLLAFVAGTALYYLLSAAGLGGHLGQVIGGYVAPLPTPRYLPEFASLGAVVEVRPLVGTMLSAAFSLALVASLDGLLCARMLERDSGQRTDGSKELMRMGVANMAAASFGGLAGAVNNASTIANKEAGARTPMSMLFFALFNLCALLFLMPVIAGIPRAVIAGILVVISLRLVDPWTLQLARRLWDGDRGPWRSGPLDLAVIVLVASVAIAVNMVVAVALGVAVAVASFLMRMSQSIVRRAYRCNVIHSRKTRGTQHMKILQRHGACIVVFELQGAIFFGTAEKLASLVDNALRNGARFVILDMKRVNEVDSTGGRIIIELHDRMLRDGQHLLLSHADDNRHVAELLEGMGVGAALTRSRIFPDTDHALEWAEDRVIMNETGTAGYAGEFPFDQLDVLAWFKPDEVEVFRNAVERRSFQRGDVLFQEGDPGDELFIIARGSASVRMRLPGEAREQRLVTFTAGTVVGEMALLDMEPRSATVIADDELVCYVLTRSRMFELAQEHRVVAFKLLSNLGREVSHRLRLANRTIFHLAS